jgi:NtrC-family two-component system sensor histidine kinase KinB
MTVSRDALTRMQEEIATLKAEARHMRQAFSALQARYFQCVDSLADALRSSAAAHATSPADEAAPHDTFASAARPLLDSFPDPLLVIDSRGCFVTVNHAYAQMVGHAPQALVGQPVADIVGENFYTALIAPREREAFTGHTVEQEGWFDDHYMQLRYCPVHVGGRNEFVMVTLRDLTAWKHADDERERLLREVVRRAAELDATLAAMTDGVIVYNGDGAIIMMNEAAEQMLGYPPEMRAMTVAERMALMPPIREDGKPLPPEEGPALRALRGEDVQNFIYAYPFPDRMLWLSAGAAPIRTPDGTSLGAVVTLTDITAQHALREQQSTFLHMVSHDLRVPLTIIQGHQQMLERTLETAVLDETSQVCMQAIGRAAQRMNAMIEDLVEAARLEGGQLRLDPHPLDLESYLSELLQRAAGMLEISRITVELPKNLPAVCVDIDRMDRIILNLLSNALKYSEPDTPVALRARRDDREVALTIIDQGQGIPAEGIPQLFGRFYRVPGGRKAEGIGLGLYITRLLVEAHGGHITVESTEGRGSAFTVTLPIAE